MDEILFDIRRLSSDFYNDYDGNRYPEILRKTDCPYIVLVIKLDNNTFAIPFRTNVILIYNLRVDIFAEIPHLSPRQRSLR